MSDVKTEALDIVARTTPPATVSFLGLTNVCLSNTVYLLTAVYIVFQIIIMFPKVKDVFKKESNEE